MKEKKYESPEPFKQALESRFRQASSGIGLARRRQLLVFDRYLARLVTVMGDTVVLKGGLALELRFHRARTTKDIDLRATGQASEILPRLQEAGRLDLGDFLTYEVSADPEHPTIQAEGMEYEGLRFHAEAKLASKIYGQPFGLDVAFADPMLGQPDQVTCEDLLAFAGIPPPTIAVYPVETHLAEKLHALTFPRRLPNSRVKDLPDMALLAQGGPFDARKLRQALRQTFDHRGTHEIPLVLPEPPESWVEVYRRMAEQDGLPWPTLEIVQEVVRAFLDPVLGGQKLSHWSPKSWQWED